MCNFRKKKIKKREKVRKWGVLENEKNVYTIKMLQLLGLIDP